jgi:hypothetical protein
VGPVVYKSSKSAAFGRPDGALVFTRLQVCKDLFVTGRVPIPPTNDAYVAIPTPAELRGPPTDWWTVTANGVPVWHFPPNHRGLAERFCHRPGVSPALYEQKEGA